MSRQSHIASRLACNAFWGLCASSRKYSNQSVHTNATAADLVYGETRKCPPEIQAAVSINTPQAHPPLLLHTAPSPHNHKMATQTRAFTSSRVASRPSVSRSPALPGRRCLVVRAAQQVRAGSATAGGGGAAVCGCATEHPIAVQRLRLCSIGGISKKILRLDLPQHLNMRALLPVTCPAGNLGS